MDANELRNRLGRVLAEEESDGPVDWVAVERLSDELRAELHLPVPNIVDEYLRGFDRRRQDQVFGLSQRNELLQFLRGKAEPGA